MGKAGKVPEKFKVALIINEYSKGGNWRELINEELYKQVDLFQKETGQMMAISPSRTREHVGRAVKSLCESGHNLFIIMGGDGTINDALQHLSHGSFIVPIPAGNANDFAKRLNIFHWRDTVQVVKNVISGKANVVGLDIGEMRFYDGTGQELRRRFVNNAGFGVTAQTVRNVEGRVNKQYLLTGFLTLLAAKSFGVTYYSSQLKRNIKLECLGAEMLLTREVGRYAKFAPYKHQNDGTIHFTVFRQMGLLDRLKVMILLQFGHQLVTSGLVEYFHDKADRQEIAETNEFGISIRGINTVWGMLHAKVPFHVDGNIVPEFEERVQDDCRITVLEKFLRTVAPC
jgi:diacylglycerol kinase family enzyme